jgi:hypothetical protein
MTKSRPDMASAGRLYGNITITAYDIVRGKKKCVYRVTKRNQITDDGRLINVELLAQLTTGTGPQSNPAWNQLWSLSIGEDATPAAAVQTALVAPVWSSQLVLPTERDVVPSLFEVKVLKTVPAGEATGSNLREVGLFTRGIQDAPNPTYPSWEMIPSRRMYARQTYSEIIKTPTMVVTYNWRLGLVVKA